MIGTPALSSVYMCRQNSRISVCPMLFSRSCARSPGPALPDAAEALISMGVTPLP
jgi:hypothetical protein